MRSLTADPSREEMIQLEALRRGHDISLEGGDEDDEALRSVCKETASSDSSVRI